MISLIYLVNSIFSRGLKITNPCGYGYYKYQILLLSSRNLNLDRGSTNEPYLLVGRHGCKFCIRSMILLPGFSRLLTSGTG